MFAVGDTIDDQYVIEKIHISGMGVVYIAEDRVSGKRFAIKSLRDESLDDQEARSRFQHEARTWIKLDRHEHIVQALLYREVQGIPLLFLEYVEGPTLAELLQKDAPLAVAQAVEFAKQFCQAMSYVHGKGVIHRDIKPQNVLITRNCQVRVTDFGLAKVWGVTHGTRGAIGTPFYMSPEQIRDASKVDQRSDIFSFGVMLYEMLTGQRPFTGENVEEVMYQIIRGRPRGPHRVRHWILKPLGGLVLRCLEKDPHRRPARFAEIASRLTAINVAREDISVYCAVCSYGSLGDHVHCPICGAATDGDQSVDEEVSTLVSRAERGSEEGVYIRPADSQHRLDDLEGMPAFLFSDHTREVICVAIGPDGRLGASGSKDKSVAVYGLRRRRCLRSLAGHRGWVYCAAFAPDGRTLASGAGDHDIRLWNANTGRELGILKGHEGHVYAVAFSPDGTKLLSGGHDNTVRLWDPRSRDLLRTLEGHREWVVCLGFTLDGTRAVSGSLDGDVRVWDLESGRCAAVLTGHDAHIRSVAVTAQGAILSGSEDGEIRVWNPAEGRRPKVLRGHSDSIEWIAPSATGRMALVADSGGELRVWDIPAGEVAQFVGELWGFSALVAISRDWGWVLTGGGGTSVDLWDLRRIGVTEDASR